MNPTTLPASDLLRLLPDAPAPAELPADLPPVGGVAFHSDRVRPGDLFVALPGAATHGIAFADDALARGAAFVMSDRAHPRGVRVPDPAAALLALGRHARAQLPGPLVAITGSAGKTTTKTLLAAALAAPASRGNFNTPLALAATLVEVWLAGHPAGTPLVLELGIDHPGEMAELVALTRPTHALLTSVAPAHLAELGDVATVAREKGVLLRAAPHAFAALDAWRQLAPDLRAHTRAYALSGAPNETANPAADPGDAAVEPDLRGVVLDTTAEGQRLRLAGEELWLSLPGRAMAENALGAMVLAVALGVPPARAAARLARARLEDGRLQRHRWGDLLLLDDSYNSNPASAALALEVLRAAPRPRVAVLGDMLELGAESERYHRELGEATRDLERVLAVGAEAAAVQQGNPDAEHLPDVDAALGWLRELEPRGTLLIKASRGMRFERLVRALLERSPTPDGTAS